MKANTKEWVQYGSAIFMLISGVTLAFVSFFLHEDVTENVLWYVAQTIIYAGSVFGISIYIKGVVDKAVNKFKGNNETNA